jgi:ribosomal protein S18 acetylase RimI-like enzyme
VYASTRAEEMELVNWSESDKQAFLRQQFTAQHTYYQQHYATAAFQVVVRGDALLGRLYVDRWASEIRIIDIALLPEYRGHGIGTRLLRDVLAEAVEVGKRVSIHVEHMNPAMRLYTRLGFRPVEERGVYVLMEWTPPATT